MKKLTLLFSFLISFCFAHSQCQDDLNFPWFENFNPEPTISCQTDLATLIPQAFDQCDTTVEILYYDEVFPGNCSSTYNIIRIYRAFDDAGNYVTESQTIHVVDEVGPEILTTPIIQLECGSEVVVPEPEIFDLCGSVVSTNLQVINDLGNIIYFWEATDDCGNTSTSQTLVTFFDTIPPQFETTFEDLTFSCDEVIPQIEALPIYSDNCDNEIDLNITIDTIPGICDNNFDVIKTYTIIDDFGNTQQLSQTIHFVDESAPSISTLENYTIECGSPIIFDTPEVSDNCSTTTIMFEYVIDTISICQINHSKIWTVQDACGNSSNVTQVITVQDLTPPTILGEVYIVSQQGDVVDSSYVTVTDCSQVNVTWTDTQVSGNNIIRDYTAVDICGNTSIFEQIINTNAIIQIDSIDFDLTVICPDTGCSIVIGVSNITGGIGPYLVGSSIFFTEFEALSNSTWDQSNTYIYTVDGDSAYWISVTDSQGNTSVKNIITNCNCNTNGNEEDEDGEDDEDGDEDDEDGDEDDEDGDDEDGDEDDEDGDEDDEDGDEDDEDGDNNNRVAICHREGNGSYHTIFVAPQAVQAHLNHGDYLGPCNEEDLDSTREWSFTMPNSNLRLRIIKVNNQEYIKLLFVK